MIFGFKFEKITFSIMNGDKFVKRRVILYFQDNESKKFDDIIFTFRACLSMEFWGFLLLLSLVKKAIKGFIFSLVQCSTTRHGVQLVLGMNQGRSPFALYEMVIHDQYT